MFLVLHAATQYATRLTGFTNHRYGLAKSISVMPGDTVLATVFAKYLERDTTLWNNGNGLATLMNTVRWGTPAAGVLIDGGTAGTTGGVTPPYAALLAKGQGTQTGAPKAYLNFLVFDRDYHVLDGGFIGVTTAAREYGQDGVHEELSKQLIIKKAGYVYLYLSNDNAALGGNAVEVYFDDFTVEHVKSPVVQQDDYYAFGLTFNSYQRENSTINKWKFQGQEHVTDLDLGWDSFKWRNHMPDIGRFFNVDPLSEKYVYNSPYAFSENKVTNDIELEGLESVPAKQLYDREWGKVENAVGNIIDKGGDVLQSIGDGIVSVGEGIGNGVQAVTNGIDSGLSFVGNLVDGMLSDDGGGFVINTSKTPLENANTKDLRQGEASSIWLDYSPMMQVNTRKDALNLVVGVESETHVIENTVNNTDNSSMVAGAGNQNQSNATTQADSTFTVKADTVKNQSVRTATSTKTGETTRKIIKKPINEVPLN